MQVMETKSRYGMDKWNNMDNKGKVTTKIGKRSKKEKRERR